MTFPMAGDEVEIESTGWSWRALYGHDKNGNAPSQDADDKPTKSTLNKSNNNNTMHIEIHSSQSHKNKCKEIGRAHV